MKRLIACLVLLGLVVSVGLIVTSCGQAVPTISTSSSQPKGLTIRGTVYSQVKTSTGNATGQGAPLVGVTLYLSGDQVSKVTTSDANGQYVFTDLPSNNTGVSSVGYNLVVTKDGYQRTMIVSGLNFGSVLGAPVSDNSVLTQDINLIDRPVVLSISPSLGTTIEAAAKTFAVAFNEAMDQASVRPTLVSRGIRATSVVDTPTLTCTWSADSKTLYATSGALLANKAYRLAVDPSATARDLTGNLLDTLGTINTSGGMVDTAYNGAAAYDYRTASGGAPGAPTGVMLSVFNKTTIDYADVTIAANRAVDLSWLAPASGSVSKYRVSVSNGASGPWAFLADATLPNNSLTSSVVAVNDALYGATGTNKNTDQQLAFVTDTVYFKVEAVNAEGATAATVVATRDATSPTITLADRVSATVGVPAAYAQNLTDFTAVGTTLNKGCYIVFSEPMNPSTLTTVGKYTISDGTVVNGATVVYNSGGASVVQLTFATALTNPTVGTVTASATSGPLDLSGNVSAANARIIN